MCNAELLMIKNFNGFGLFNFIKSDVVFNVFLKY